MTLSQHLLPLVPTMRGAMCAWLLLSVPSLMTTTTTSAGALGHSCYSCMSAVAENYWDITLKNFYQRPQTFTDRCERPLDGNSYVGLQICNKICLTLAFSLQVMGIPSDTIYVRGCANSISRSGFRNGTMNYFDIMDTCRRLHMSELFNSVQTGSPADVELRVCSCLGDKCNSGSSVNAAAPSMFRHMTLLLITFAVFISSCLLCSDRYIYSLSFT